MTENQFPPNFAPSQSSAENQETPFGGSFPFGTDERTAAPEAPVTPPAAPPATEPPANPEQQGVPGFGPPSLTEADMPPNTPASAFPETQPSNTQPSAESQTQPTPESPTTVAPVMPSEVDSYKPLETQKRIAEISPGKFDNLTKVLDILRQSKPDSISIKQSYIHESVSGSVIVADVTSIFDGEKVDFQITDPKKHVDLFKSFKGNNNIFILDDPENTRYIMTNGPIKIFLPKQIDQLVAEINAPDLSNAPAICSKIINKEVRDEIKGLGRHSNSIEYLIQQNNIKAMHIPDTGIYRFEEFVKDPGVAKLDETNAELVLKSEFFLPVDSDSYRITITKREVEQDYVSVTECNSGMAKMWIFEQLEDTTGGNVTF